MPFRKVSRNSCKIFPSGSGHVPNFIGILKKKIYSILKQNLKNIYENRNSLRLSVLLVTIEIVDLINQLQSTAVL